jgi:hypothetical protein
MFRIEFESPVETETCKCCGSKTTTLTRFVYKDGDAFAVYFASFVREHSGQPAIATISIGEWGDGTSPDDRSAFANEIRCATEQYQVAIIDSVRSPWKDAQMIGRTLDRAEPMSHPMLSEVFHLTDHIVGEDEPLKSYLDKPRLPTNLRSSQ